MGSDPIPVPEVGQVWRGSNGTRQIRMVNHMRRTHSGSEVRSSVEYASGDGCYKQPLPMFMAWARKTGARPVEVPRG